MSEGMLITKNNESTELPYVNDSTIYNFNSIAWQMVRPSFLFFLNMMMPRYYSPTAEPMEVNIAEVGVAGGLNSMLMLKAWDKPILHMVDSWAMGQTEESALKLTSAYADRVKLVKMDSVTASKEYPDNFFDYIYIDADHGYESVYADLKAWYPKLKQGGMFAGHDWWYPEVRKALQDWYNDEQIGQKIFGIHCYSDESVKPTYKDEDNQACDWWMIKR